MTVETRGVRVCPGCGAGNAADALFCVECGHRLEEEAPAACPSCGRALRAGMRFCNACGARIGAPAAAPARHAPHGLPGSRRALVAVFGGLAAVVVLAVGALVFLRGGGGEEEAAEPLDLPDVPLNVDPEALAALQTVADALPEGTGENDREQMRSLLGPPNTFTLTFERGGEAGDGPLTRYETWFYYDLGTAYEFADGALVQDMPMTLPAGPTILPPQRYDPVLFGRDTTWEEITALLLDPGSFAPIELEQEYQVPLTFYAGEQLIVAFDDEGLFYVETVALSQETEGGQ